VLGSNLASGHTYMAYMYDLSLPYIIVLKLTYLLLSLKALLSTLFPFHV
jgi:hypothetical protein